MKQIMWEVNYLSPPHITRYCKKCGTKTEYQCSNAFRVNAQKKTIDVWLIYKCVNCDSTWNMTVYTRISPKSIAPELLRGFHGNDEHLALRYSMDQDLLQKNGVSMCMPEYEITGEMVPAGIPVALTIKTDYPSPIKVSALLRQRLKLSQNQFQKLVGDERIRGVEDMNLNKVLLKDEVKLILEMA